MKISVKLLAILLCFSLLSCNSSKKENSETASTEEEVKPTIDLTYSLNVPEVGFTINFPGQPELTTDPIESEELGTLETVMYLYEYSVSLAYIVAYTEYPADKLGDFDVDELLDVTMYGFVEELGMQVDSKEKINLKKNPGLEYFASGNDFYAHFNVYIVNNVLFQVGVLSDKELNHADSHAFLKSFKLL
jgi:hypothetical protein